MKNIFFYIFLFLSTSYLSQFDHLKNYIPYDSLSYISHPIIEIKTWIHVIQKSKNDPQNITQDSIEFIKKQFQWINQTYSNLYPPTLANSKGNKPFIKDSRIRFIIDTVTFHINENDWDRSKIAEQENKKKLLKILKIDSDSGSVIIKGIRHRYSPIFDSVVINKTKHNNGLFHVEKIEKRGVNTILFLKEELLVSEDSTGFVNFFIKINKNCSEDNWVKYTNKSKDFLHIFFTGSSENIPAFGCGPSPYFLNISRVIHNGGYATAQLLSHELGHCLGLSHTDRPQFNDLPSTDKFGWISCNDVNTSNNIMGYNICRSYLSPLQIGYIHYRYSNNKALLNCITKPYNPNNILCIDKDSEWDKDVFIQKDIVVKKNQTLKIKEQLIMLNEASIILEKKSRLIIDGGVVFSNGKNWKGIIKCKSEFKREKIPSKKKNIATIELVNNGQIVY